jgi:hypothetical protein
MKVEAFGVVLVLPTSLAGELPVVKNKSYVGQAVVVREKRGGGLLPRAIAHRLEGSRFGTYLANPPEFRLIVGAAEACGNRRLPRVTQRENSPSVFDSFTPRP